MPKIEREIKIKQPTNTKKEFSVAKRHLNRLFQCYLKCKENGYSLALY
mgnify:CR=1 FL=1